MITYPVFSPVYRVEIQDDKLLLSSDGRFTILNSKVCLSIAPYLTGREPLNRIIYKLRDQHTAEEIHFTILLLEQDGYIVDGESLKTNNHHAFWQRMSDNVADVADRMASRSVDILGVGFDHTDAFISTLEELKVSVKNTAPLRVILATDYLHPDLEEINQAALSNKTSLLLINPFPPSLLIGPVIIPGETGCWECLKHRLSLNRPADVFLSEQGTAVLKPILHDIPKPAIDLGLIMAAIETTKWLLSESAHEYMDGLKSIDLATLEIQHHPFIRRPQCSACGDPLISATNTISLNKGAIAKKKYGFRIQPSEKTVEAMEFQVSNLTGIVRSISPVASENKGLIHNYTAGHGSRMNGHSIESLRYQTRDQSGGKGKTDSQSKASAMGEAIERVSAIYEGQAPFCIAPFASLGKNALHPNSIALFGQQQFEERSTWNAAQNGYFHRVPEPLNIDKPIAWTELVSLINGEKKLVPTAYCYYGYDGPGIKFCRSDSNGLAAGNCLEEAIFSALLELAERDAVSIWWYNRIRYPGVDLQSLNDPYISEIVSYYRSLSRDLWVLDVTNDLSIPTFVAISPKLGDTSEDILLGFGAHIDASTAITRAVLEVNQSLPTVLKSKVERERMLLPDFADAISWWNTASVENQPYLTPLSSEQKSIESYPSFDSIDLKEQIDRLVSHVATLDLDVLVLNLTKPDVNLPAVRVIVPGLRHFWRRLAPGRLYDVPLKQGLLEKPNRENHLNPISLFL